MQPNTFIENDEVVLKEYPLNAAGAIESFIERTSNRPACVIRMVEVELRASEGRWEIGRDLGGGSVSSYQEKTRMYDRDLGCHRRTSRLAFA